MIMFKQSVIVISIRIASVGAMFLINILLARTLGISDYGTLVYLLAWAQIASILVQSGLPSESTRSIAISDYQNVFRSISNNIASSYALLFMAWLLLNFLVFIYNIFFEAKSGLGPTSLSLSILVLLMSAVALNSGILRGLGFAVTSQIPEQLLRPVFYFLGLALFVVLGFSLTPLSAVWIQATALLISSVVGALLILKKITWGSAVIEISLIRKFHFALPFLIFSALQILTTQVPIVLLGLAESPTDVALFRAAVQFSDSVNVVLLGIAAVIGPIIARHHSRAEWNELRQLLRKSHKNAFLFLVLPTLILAVFPEKILTITFGAEFGDAFSSLRILIIGKLIYSIIGFSGLALSMIGRANSASLATAAALVSMCVMVYPLTTLFGHVGAAFAVAFNGVLTPLICTYIYNKAIRSAEIESEKLKINN